MRTIRALHAVDSHTEGMPTRVVVGGVGVIPGDSMAARRRYFVEHLDHLRTHLVCEPRGHAAMSGAILQPPTVPEADFGVLFIEVSGCLPMCGHGTMGVATVLVETGMVPVCEPTTTVRLETPAGLVEAQVHVDDGVAVGVTVRNVPSFVLDMDSTVDVPGYGSVSYDMAYGGNFVAVVALKDLGLPLDRAQGQVLLDAGRAVMSTINERRSPVHPEDGRIAGCRHVYLNGPDSTPRRSRHAMVVHPGWFDRSPCGTGTSARMAQLHARGLLEMGDEMVNESFIGTHFVGRLLEETRVGERAAVVPAITGRAWITGTAQYLLDPRDPFPAGFTV